jgi:hypothetical protein
MAYKGRPSAKPVAREFPFVVEIMVPEGGFGRRLDDMHAFHRQRRITDHHIPRRRDGEHDYIRWCPIMTTGRTKLGGENEIALGLAITDSSLVDSDAGRSVRHRGA